MTTRNSSLLMPLALLALTGCGPIGWIYTTKTEPIVLDMRDTKNGSKVAELSSKEIHEPITGVGIGVAWSSRAIGEAAKKKGIENVYFADLHTMSLFGGIYRQDTIMVCGD